MILRLTQYGWIQLGHKGYQPWIFIGRTDAEAPVLWPPDLWWPVLFYGFVVLQLLKRVWLFVTPWTASHQASLFFTVSWSLLKLLSIESVISSNHLIFFHPLLLLTSIFPSIRIFSNQLAPCIRWPEYWSFSISLSNEFSGLISFRIGWFDLLAVQETLKSLLYHHSSKASVLRHSASFIVPLSHPYMTTGKTIALSIQTSVGKVIWLYHILSVTSLWTFGLVSVLSNYGYNFYEYSCITLCGTNVFISRKEISRSGMVRQYNCCLRDLRNSCPKWLYHFTFLPEV